MKEKVHVMIPEEEIIKRIDEIAAQINEEYKGRQIRLICVLKGGVFFAVELAKRICMPVTLDFMAASSYGMGTESSGTLTIKKDLDEDISGLDCIVVEDVVDTGNTLSLLKKMLLARGPASLKICVLLDKPDKREVPIDADYTGFLMPDKFLVGYGLDYAQKYRNLPYIGELEFTKD